MRDIKKITLSAILSAMGVVLMYVGAVLELLDLAVPAAVSLLLIFALLELRGAYPYLIYAVTAVLALLLLPGAKTSAFVYALLMGPYPFVKYFAERRTRRIAWVLKLLFLTAGLGVFWLLCAYVIMLPEAFEYLVLLLMAACIPVFILYDVTVTRLIVMYDRQWRRRIARFLR